MKVIIIKVGEDAVVRIILYLPHLLVVVVSEVQLVCGGDFVAAVVVVIRI